MRQFIQGSAVLLLTAGLLAGCERGTGERFTHLPPLAGQYVAVGLAAHVVQTKIERQLDVTCSPINFLSDGSYCVSNYKPTDRQEVWCFRTLAGVDCYGEPDPYSLKGRALPDEPRPLADPRMPMSPPGRRANPQQVAVMPIGQADPGDNPVLIAPVSQPVMENPVKVAPVPGSGPPAILVTPPSPSELDRRLGM
jgi:hypothetical protein